MNETDCYEATFSNIDSSSLAEGRSGEGGLISEEISDATVGYSQESF